MKHIPKDYENVHVLPEHLLGFREQGTGSTAVVKVFHVSSGTVCTISCWPLAPAGKCYLCKLEKLWDALIEATEYMESRTMCDFLENIEVRN